MQDNSPECSTDDLELLRDFRERPLDIRGQLDTDEELARIEVVLARFIDDTNHPMLRRKVIVEYRIQLSELE